MSRGHVLSIQSHVVSGYVGNRCATWVLQTNGLEVDPLNTVHFSNHACYPTCKGTRTSGADLMTILDGLEQNSLIQYSHLLTGYIGSPEALQCLADIYRTCKKHNPELMFVCDPVMGDNGRLYVPETLLPYYRDELLPLADLITPNQFEAELLTESTIRTPADAVQTCRKFHERGISSVVITSSSLGAEHDEMVLVGSSMCQGQQSAFTISFRRVTQTLFGTGDVFASLLLARLHESPDNFQLAVEQTLSAVQRVIHKTIALDRSELALVHCLDELRDHSVTHHGVPISS